jgi:hypothetical protein
VTNNINVSLDNSNGVNKLDVVDNGGQNEVSQNPTATTISWNLTGVLTQGSFVAMDATPPGFEWVGTSPPAGLFGEPQVEANGNSLSITDNHVDSTTDGQWIYQLRVNYGGSVISTIASTPGGTVTNPVIINK